MKFDLNQCVKPSQVPFKWVTDTLNGQDGKWDRLVEEYGISDATVKVISGSGFLSYVMRVVFDFKDTEETFNIILKVPTIQILKDGNYLEGNESLATTLYQFHNQEVLFHQHIAPKCDVLYFPKMYGYVNSDLRKGIHGQMLVEDIGDRGYLPDVLNGMDFDQCSEVMQVLAKFHAFSLNNLPEEFKQSLEAGLLNIQEHLKFTSATFEIVPEFNEIRAELEAFHDKYSANLLKVHETFEIPPILTHGDFWANNMFFERKNGVCTKNVLTIFDWQVLQLGTGMTDLARFLMVSADAKVLKENIDDLLEVYYLQFEKSVKDRRVSMPYDFEKISNIKENVLILALEGPANVLSYHGQVILVSIYAFNLALIIVIQPANYIYRYICVTRMLPLSPQMAFAVYAVSVLIAVPFGVTCYFSYMYSAKVRPGFNYGTLWFNVKPLPVLLPADTGSFFTQIYLAYVIVAFGFSYLISMLFAKKTVAALKNNKHLHGAKAIQMQNQLSTTLFVQTVLPVFTSVGPSMIITLSTVFGVNIGAFGIIMYTCLAFIPLLNPMATIFFIRPFRTTVLKMFSLAQNGVEPNYSTFSVSTKY
ncbi:unnamed protein product [Bursaphelenchus okinawaensis]|uniref:CHK kinase-like domain-containing protein n=1 Tax=Bursaphelenchus okinawaensis TaxID=465554 RepID=A0A811LCG0_9BILA|nr:unnamed protein product [Bursaphelenchus okinawaensis]CAG9120556.1 unnamed protein product [Bursaphelenchus okinawaensis]